MGTAGSPGPPGHRPHLGQGNRPGRTCPARPALLEPVRLCHQPRPRSTDNRPRIPGRPIRAGAGSGTAAWWVIAGRRFVTSQFACEPPLFETLSQLLVQGRAAILFAKPLDLDDEHKVVWSVNQECNEALVMLAEV